MTKYISFAITVLIFGTTFSNANDVGKWSLNDSTTATSAVDSINSFNAIEEGDVIFEKDGALTSTGTSAEFDGSSILEVPHNTTLNPNGSFSIEAWVKPTGGANTTRSFISSRSSNKNGFIVRIDSNNKFRFYVGDGSWRYVEGPTVSLDQWYHVLATFESRSATDGIHSGVAKIFINGKLAQFKTLTYKPNSSTVRPFRIGGGGDKDQDVTSTFNFIGGIDEVRLTNDVVNPLELSSNFDQTKGLTREIYYDIPNHGVHLITGNPKFPWNPDVIDHIKDFSTGTNTGDNYGARIRGFVTVPEDGSYTFHLASDDRGDLRISLDGTEANLQSIATVSGWTGINDWDKYESQRSAAFNLTAGQVIYTEAFFKEGGGGDHLAVAWSKNGGAIELITKEHLTPFIYEFAEQQTALSNAIAVAQTAHTNSAANIGTEQGQFSESARTNFNLEISASQQVLSNETIAFNIAREVVELEAKIQEFLLGVGPVKLTGEIFGDELYWGGNWYIQNAFDGNINTSYHYLNRDFGYVGIDLGKGNETALTHIKFFPRKDYEKRMTNNVFQGSQDGQNWTTIFTITTEPSYEWTTAQITDETAYRYYRYYDVEGGSGYGNVAEIEFHGYVNQALYMLYHEIISVKADTADQILPASSLTAEHGGLVPQLITYRVLELPTNGILKLDGAALVVDSTFTQEDIDKELLTFSSDTSRLNDSFKVAITSSVGGSLPEVIVDIKIDSDLDGLSDQQEIALGTSYDNADTNNNGIDDKWEYENGMDPIADTLTPLVESIQGENGLSAAYVYGRFSQVSDFNLLAPAKVTKVSNINFSASYWQEFANSGAVHDVGAKFSGYIYIPVGGNYKFIINSDDGSKLYINGSEVINNDGTHGFEQKSGIVNLTAGFHQIRCDYFEARGNHGCILQWEGPNRPRQTIPSSYFFLSIPEHQALIDSIDRDQDGLTDILEAQEGTDPLNPDSDGDRLLDGEEFHATYNYKTNPLNVDTDSDTVSDYDEIFVFKSNPLVPDFDGTVTELINILPKDYSSNLGTWITSGDEVFCTTRRGYVEYTVNITYPGLYKLASKISQSASSPTRNVMDLHLYVDDEFISRQKIDVSSGAQEVSWLTTNLTAGEHKFKLFWDNVYLGTNLRIKTLQLSRPGGPDGDENGRPDWVDSYLSNTYSINTFNQSSKVSPAQIEGKGKYISKMAFSLGAPVQRATKDHWFIDIPLEKDGPTDFELDFEEELDSKPGSITWVETNVLDEGSITVRQGSKMLLNAVIDGDLEPTASVKVGEEAAVTVGPENALEYQFDTVGTFEVVADYQGSQTLSKTLTVKVIGVENTDAPYIWRDKTRFWNWPNLPEEIVLQHSGMEMTPQAEGGFIIKRDEVLEDVNIIARIGETGEIVKSLDTKAFWLRDVVEGRVFIVEEFEDGTKVTNDTVFGYQIPEGMEIKINTISGVTFPDGSRNMTITKDNFDALNRWTIELIKSPDRSGANCHWYKVWQNGTFVGQQNK